MITKAWAQGMMQSHPNIRSTDCVIRGHCRTRVFAFPKANLVAEERPRPAVIVERSGARATVVSDLPGYFRQGSPFRHYAICCFLRSKIDDALAKCAARSNANRFPLFVVLEQEKACNTPMEEGTCFVVDQEMIIGGRTGEEAIIAWQVSDAPWPEVDDNDTEFVNIVLAAVKIEQDETEVIREVAEASCFYNENGQAVYPRTATVSANLSVSSPLTGTEVNEKVTRMRTLIGAFEAKRRADGENIANLVDALRLEKIDSDHYRRAWYLCLFEAIEAVLSGRDKHEFYQRHRGYRSTIGHPKPHPKMDMDEFRRLQRDVLAILRRIYLAE